MAHSKQTADFQLLNSWKLLILVKTHIQYTFYQVSGAKIELHEIS